MASIRRLGAAVSIAAAIAAGPGWLGGAQAKTLYQWVQLGPDGASARAITDDAACPRLMVDGKALAMATRAEPKQAFRNVPAAVFGVRSCERAVPEGAVAAAIDGKALPLPRPNPGRILVIGDTGCRLKEGDPVQACNDPAGWPFPHLAQAAASARPDLVIDVGDYHYRETACPPAHAGCQGSPFGYGWDAWEADFFKPATPLLAAAPWVMTRGNHEDVARAGEGWSRFLDYGPAAGDCADLTGVYLARLGEFGLIVVDGANAPDPKGDAGGLAGKLAAQFAPVAAQAPAESWLMTHRPLNAMRGEKGELKVENSVLQQALGALMPNGVSMIVSGHIHFFQAVDFGPSRPAQLVAGTGGDNLEPMVPKPVAGVPINGLQALNATTRSGFGYMVWDRLKPGTWSGVVFDDRGAPIERCRLDGRRLTCGL
ncbi:MAG: metallophosphoesterase [Proteobacteria bacterium]|nr:metallophosphoesterase [Pseudomonadota bacterium]MBI3497656.1 metallophosphoesterase [Pseudomonadota bacterium]